MSWLCLIGAALAAGEFVEEDLELLWTVEEPSGGNFGWAVSAIEDVDGDGASDVITCDPFASGSGGEVRLLSGATGALLFSETGPPRSQLGFAVADAGDLNGDGVHDVLAGAPGRSEVFVFSGVDGEVLHHLTSPGGSDSFGAAVSSAGDVNGDGVPDLLVGAETSAATGADSGRAYVLSGADGAELYRMEAEAAGDHFGSGVGLVGDLNGDGVPDAVIGARDAGPNRSGRLYLTSGVDGATLRMLEDDVNPGSLGYFFVDGVGDVNGDGVPDVFGGDFSNDGVAYRSGAAWVWSGADGALLLSFYGDAEREGLGTGRGAGDIDGDGVPDISVGSWTSSAGAAAAGRVTVFSGVDGSVIRTITSLTPGENFGFDVVGVGDVDGDGDEELVASGATLNAVYLIAGQGGALGEDSGDTGPGDGAPSDDKGCGCSGVGGAGGGLWLLALAWLGCRRGRSGVDRAAPSRLAEPPPG